MTDPSGAPGPANASNAFAVTWHGLEAIALENAWLRVTMVPAMGGRIVELIDRAGERDLLWHNPRATPRPAPYGAHFDDWWSGGWDEIFPSGDAGRLHGEPLPYMGELWCVPWEASISGPPGGTVAIDAGVYGTIAAARFERRLSLDVDAPVVRARYRIENLDVRPLPFTWGIHPAFAVGPTHRIDHPATMMEVGTSSSDALGRPGQTYEWPNLPEPDSPTGTRDLSLVRARDAAVFGGHWAMDLRDGWLALTDTATGRGVTIVFDRAIFPTAWLWQVYGGWRGHHHVALEPWTSRPMDLDGAIATGRERTLAPGEVLETEVAFVLHEGLDRVRGVERDAGRILVR